MAAMPLAVKHGAKAKIAFSGKHVENVAPVEVTMPADRAAIQVAPKGPGVSGWPVPVYASDIEELVEQEPNNEPAKANRLPVPCGITARFLDKGDVDHFVFAAKKGAKYAIVAETYEVLSPAEVYLIVKDAKGAELAKSNPAEHAGPDRLHRPGRRRLHHLRRAPELRPRADRGVPPVGPRGRAGLRRPARRSTGSPWPPARRRSSRSTRRPAATSPGRSSWSSPARRGSAGR